jgi:transposase
MTSIALERSDVIVGVDTHKDQHVAVALDGLGGSLDDRAVAATNDGYAELLAWALDLGPVTAFGVEGCGSYGIGLARFLRRHGHKVIEVSRPPRKGDPRGQARSHRRSTRSERGSGRQGDGHSEDRQRVHRVDPARQDRP